MGSQRVLGGTRVSLEACLVYTSSCRLETFQFLTLGAKLRCSLLHPTPARSLPQAGNFRVIKSGVLALAQGSSHPTGRGLMYTPRCPSSQDPHWGIMARAGPSSLLHIRLSWGRGLSRKYCGQGLTTALGSPTLGQVHREARELVPRSPSGWCPFSFL